MTLSPSELATLQEKGSNLSERLSGVFHAADDDNVMGSRQLTRWKEKVAGGTQERLPALLMALGSSPASTARLGGLLGAAKLQPGTPVPPWASFTAEFVRRVAADATGLKTQPPDQTTAIRARETIPFRPLYGPIVDLAHSIATGRLTAASTSLLSVHAWDDLRALLVARISMVAARALQTTFQTQMSFETAGLAGWFEQQRRTEDGSGPDLRKHYTRFVIEQAEDGLKPFVSSYPVAARLVSQVALDWIDSVVEFVQRFEADRETLIERFHDGKAAPKIVGIKGGISDPHHGGRTVLILRFENGMRLVYKPRPLTIDTLFFDLLGTLNRHATFPLPQALQVLDRGAYGWVPHVSGAPCRNRLQAERFYHRAGALVCLVHWLGGIDCHGENFIAAGEHTVLIDLECLAHPFRPSEYAAGERDALTQVGSSALRTGFLPLLQDRLAGAPLYDNSALGAPLTRFSLYPIPWWQKVNTDQMRWVYARRPVTKKQHRPRRQGKTLNARDFSASVLAGYQQMAECLRGSHASEFCQHRQRISDCTRRFIRRPTVIYATLTLKTLDPQFLRSGVARSIELQALPCEPGDEAEWVSEIASLEKLDVPYFRIDGRSQQRPPPPAPPLDGPACAAQMRLIELSLNRQLVAVEGNVYAKELRGN